MSQKPSERNSAPEETEIGVENMLMHPSWHGMKLLLEVKLHKMNRVAGQILLKMCQQIDQCTLCPTGSERVDDKDYASGSWAHLVQNNASLMGGKPELQSDRKRRSE
jgi:hypothetical protein